MTARSFSGNLIATTNSRQSAKLKDRKQNFTNDRIGPVQSRRFSSSMAATGTKQVLPTGSFRPFRQQEKVLRR